MDKFSESILIKHGLPDWLAHTRDPKAVYPAKFSLKIGSELAFCKETHSVTGGKETSSMWTP